MTGMLLCLLCLGQVERTGVVLPASGYFAEQVQVVGPEGIRELTFGQASSPELPEDDRGRFRLTLFTTPDCTPCRLLRRDLESAECLKPLVEWTSFNTVDSSHRSQAARVKAFDVDAYPTLVLYPSPLQDVYPYHVVFRQEGYDGDAESLCRRMYDALVRFRNKHITRPMPAPEADTKADAEADPAVVPDIPRIIPPPNRKLEEQLAQGMRDRRQLASRLEALATAQESRLAATEQQVTTLAENQDDAKDAAKDALRRSLEALVLAILACVAGAVAMWLRRFTIPPNRNGSAS